MTLTTAMEEDAFLVEVAGWARYYEWAGGLIQQAIDNQLSEAPPQEIIDDPSSFKRWIKQCEAVYFARINE